MKTSNKPPDAQGPNRQKPKIPRNAIKPSALEGFISPPRTSPVHEGGVSGNDRQIAEIVAAVNRLPETREQKILKIKKLVDSGTYILDARNIAESILKDL